VAAPKNGAATASRRKTAVKEAVEAPKVLAIVGPEERAEYVLRMSLVTAKRHELAAASAYLDALGEELRVRYRLPVAYDLNLQTGEATERG